MSQSPHDRQEAQRPNEDREIQSTQTARETDNASGSQTQPTPHYASHIYQAPPPRAPYGFVKSDGWFALLMVLMGFLFIRFIISGGGGVSVTVYTILFDAILLCYMWTRKIKPTGVTYACLALSLAFGAYFGLFGGGTMSFFVLLFHIALSAYMVFAAFGAWTENSLRYVGSDTFSALLITPFGHFDAAPRAFGNSIGAKNNGSRRMLYAVLGLILALPLFAFVGSLLSKADPVFERLWSSLAHAVFERFHVTLIEFFFGIPIAMYLFGLMYGALRRRAAPRTAERAEAAVRSCRVLPLPLVMGAVIPLLALYVLFFITQMPYLLSAFQSLIPKGFTQAEYARRGFFELCGVCTVNMLVLIGLNIFTKTDHADPETGIVTQSIVARICGALLCLFSMTLAIISLRKMLLYIQNLGLTQKRVYTSVFMVFLCVAFALALAGLWKRGFAPARWIALSGTAMLLAVCLLNTDGLIARYNIWQAQTGRIGKLDVNAMRELGEAAVPPLAELLESGDCPEVTKVEIRVLLLHENNYRVGLPNDWRSETLNLIRCREALERLR